MRRDLIRSARGEIIDFDLLAERAKAKMKEQPKTSEVKRAVSKSQPARRLNASFVPLAQEDELETVAEASPAETTLIVAKIKKKVEKPTAASDAAAEPIAD